MARRTRGPVYAGVYHVWRRTAGPIEMFRDDFDRTAFCDRLHASILKYSWTCMAFVLMPTHFHLLLEVADDVLQPGMRDLFGPYAQAYNRRWGRSGHLRAGPYKLRRVDGERDLRGVYRYVVRNPVRSKLCERPQDWEWSSCCRSAGYAKRRFVFVDDRTVLGTIHENVTKARELLRDLVEVE
jgi:REP element-mobilizing transposase RayT